MLYPAILESRTFMLAVLGLGLSAAGGMFLFVQSIAMIGAQRAVIIDSLEPLFSAFYASTLLQERMTPIALTGGLLIVAGVIIDNLPLRTTKPRFVNIAASLRDTDRSG